MTGLELASQDSELCLISLGESKGNGRGNFRKFCITGCGSLSEHYQPFGGLAGFSVQILKAVESASVIRGPVQRLSSFARDRSRRCVKGLSSTEDPRRSVSFNSEGMVTKAAFLVNFQKTDR